MDPLPPNTTLQQDHTLAGQRRINIIWEVTQAVIAVVITIAVIVCAVLKTNSTELTNSFFLIVGFYFSRTNHAQIGGTGEKVRGPYEGR